MLRVLSLIMLALTAAGILIHGRRNSSGKNQEETGASSPGALSRLMPNRSPDAITLVTSLILAISGFVPLIVFGGTLSGFPLIMHMVVAPFFVICLTWSVIVRIHRRQFVPNDWIIIKKGDGNREETGRMGLLRQKLFFWSFLIVSVLVIVSILASMYPLVSSEGLGYLIAVHGYSSLVFVVLGMIYFYLKLRDRERKVQ